MGLMYVPPRRNQFQSQMFNMLSNLAFQKMAHKQRMEIADKELKLYDIKTKEKRAYEKQKTEEERKYEESQSAKERRSELVEKGFVSLPTGTATTMPGVAGMNQQGQEGVFFDEESGRVWKRPPKDEWKRIDDIVVNGKKIAVQRNVKTGKIQAIGSNAPKSAGMSVVTPDGTVVQVGGGPSALTKPAQSATEKEISGMYDELLQITDIEKNEFKDVLTFQGKIKQGALKLADKAKIDIGAENKKYIQKSRKFVEGLEQYFNQYRKRITGAQAAIKEIEMLRTSVLNKKITPSEFDASIARVKEMLSRGIRLKRMLLSRGVRDKKVVDEMFNTGMDVPEQEIDRYGDQLEKSGMSKEEVVKRLQQEGYF